MSPRLFSINKILEGSDNTNYTNPKHKVLLIDCPLFLNLMNDNLLKINIDLPYC